MKELWLTFCHFFVSAVLPILADFSPWASKWHVLCVICCVDYSRYDVNHLLIKGTCVKSLVPFPLLWHTDKSCPRYYPKACRLFN